MSIEIKDKKFGNRYLLPFKYLVVQEIELEGSVAMVCARHGIDKSVVRNWLKLYGSLEYHSKQPNRRSLSERHHIAREIISGKLTIVEAQLKYNIKTASAVYMLIREYKRGQQDLLTTFPEAIEQSSAVSGTDNETHSVLQLAELKIRALEIMLDIASKEFNVDIRKKFGAKP